jgi:hypothetical protein
MCVQNTNIFCSLFLHCYCCIYFVECLHILLNIVYWDTSYFSIFFLSSALHQFLYLVKMYVSQVLVISCSITTCFCMDINGTVTHMNLKYVDIWETAQTVVFQWNLNKASSEKNRNRNGLYRICDFHSSDWRMPSSGTWRCVGLVRTDGFEEHVTSIFRVEESVSEERGCSWLADWTTVQKHTTI